MQIFPWESVLGQPAIVWQEITCLWYFELGLFVVSPRWSLESGRIWQHGRTYGIGRDYAFAIKMPVYIQLRHFLSMLRAKPRSSETVAKRLPMWIFPCGDKKFHIKINRLKFSILMK